MTRETFKHSWLGSGVTLPCEYEINDRLKIRPVAIKGTIEEFAERTNSQFEYGLLCSIAPMISFELETTAETENEAAFTSWNNQYALVFLSIVGRSFVYHSIQLPGGHAVDSSQKFLVSYPHCVPVLNNTPKILSDGELLTWKELLPNFISLLADERFLFAVSVASNLYVHPRATIQVASIYSAIEALLDVDQELRFRISMIVAKMLAPDLDSERILLFKKMKKLYDARSKCVHGGGIKAEKVIECRDESLEILRQLILTIVKRNEIPTKEKMDEILVGS